MWWASASIMYGFVTSGGSSALRVLYTEDGGPDELAQTSLCVKFLLVGKPSRLFCFILFYVAVACTWRQRKSVGVMIAISLYFSIDQFDVSMLVSVLLICFLNFSCAGFVTLHFWNTPI